jgi:hypothetical protein
MREATTFPSHADDLRVVVDAQIALAMFLVRRDRPTVSSTQRLLLQLLPMPTFHWLWTPDILADYARGALAIERDTRLMRRAAFDRAGFELLLSALQLRPAVPVSVATLRDARRRIGQASRVRERDLDDAIYLACAVDGGAHRLTSQDSSLLSIGSPYEGVRIVTWAAFVEELQVRGSGL